MHPEYTALKTVLVAHDGSPSAEEAVLGAVGLARAKRAKLILTRSVAEDDTLLAAELELQALARRLREVGVGVIVRVRRGDATAMLDAECRMWQPDWIVA